MATENPRRYTIYIGFRVYEKGTLFKPDGTWGSGARYAGSLRVHGWTLKEVKEIVGRFKTMFEQEAEREREAQVAAESARGDVPGQAG